MKEIKPNTHPYFTQVDEVSDEERIYVRSFFGHVDLSRWREATQEERDAHKKRMEEREQEGGAI
jgi:hypothetical protein